MHDWCTLRGYDELPDYDTTQDDLNSLMEKIFGKSPLPIAGTTELTVKSVALKTCSI